MVSASSGRALSATLGRPESGVPWPLGTAMLLPVAVGSAPGRPAGPSSAAPVRLRATASRTSPSTTIATTARTSGDALGRPREEAVDGTGPLSVRR